jgi:hypothetical protein
VKLLRIYTGSDGESHFEEVDAPSSITAPGRKREARAASAERERRP